MNKKLFQQSTIKSVKGVKFGNDAIQCETKGVALYHPNFGYLSFGTNVDQYGIEIPYIPAGGRKVLTSMLESGLTDYSNIKWLKPYSA